MNREHNWYIGGPADKEGWLRMHCKRCGREVLDFVAGTGQDQVVMVSGAGIWCDLPPVIPQSAITAPSFLADVETELARAQSLHAPMHSMHEGYAVILEELDEVKAHVWLKQSSRDPAAVYKELVQLAAMVARMAVECGADDFKK